MKGKKRVHAFKNRMEHWQVVSIGLTVYDAIAMILAFFLALWFRFDCRYTMIPKEYLNFYFKFKHFKICCKVHISGCHQDTYLLHM